VYGSAKGRLRAALSLSGPPRDRAPRALGPARRGDPSEADLFAYVARIRLTPRSEADLYGYIEQIRLTRAGAAASVGLGWSGLVNKRM